MEISSSTDGATMGGGGHRGKMEEKNVSSGQKLQIRVYTDFPLLFVQKKPKKLTFILLSLFMQHTKINVRLIIL